MYSRLGSAIRYIRYYLTASNGKGHGVHSPFVFDFIIRVLNDERYFYAYSSVEALPTRNGTGPSPKEIKFNRLLFRIADHYSPVTILELGASNGLRTACLASARANSRVITWEHSPEKAAVAAENFNNIGLRNIRLITGNFEEIFDNTVQQAESIDLVVINENPEQDPFNIYKKIRSTLHDHSMLIISGIHAGAEMEQAWNRIKGDESVTLSIDLFEMGILLFRKENRVKQHFTIRF